LPLFSCYRSSAPLMPFDFEKVFAQEGPTPTARLQAGGRMPSTIPASGPTRRPGDTRPGTCGKSAPRRCLHRACASRTRNVELPPAQRADAVQHLVLLLRHMPGQPFLEQRRDRVGATAERHEPQSSPPLPLPRREGGSPEYSWSVSPGITTGATSTAGRNPGLGQRANRRQPRPGGEVRVRGFS